MNRKSGLGHALAAAALVGVLCLPLRSEGTGIPVLDISNLLQNVISVIQETLSVAQEIEQVVNQATQIAQQIQQLEHEIEMLRNMAINTTPGSTVAWGDVQAIFGSLSRALETGLAISYALSNVQSTFEDRFPGYVPPTDWSAAYDSWATTVIDTLRGTLASAGINVGDASSVQAALRSLRSANDGAEGRLEAIQIGNQIASLQVEELAKLRQLAAAQISAQNVYLGAQEAKHAGSAAAFDAWLANAPSTIPVSRGNEGLGLVPRP
jgi:P-type conjugative transfer protein TrbJ